MKFSVNSIPALKRVFFSNKFHFPCLLRASYNSFFTPRACTPYILVRFVEKKKIFFFRFKTSKADYAGFHALKYKKVKNHIAVRVKAYLLVVARVCMHSYAREQEAPFFDILRFGLYFFFFLFLLRLPLYLRRKISPVCACSVRATTSISYFLAEKFLSPRQGLTNNVTVYHI